MREARVSTACSYRYNNPSSYFFLYGTPGFGGDRITFFRYLPYLAYVDHIIAASALTVCCCVLELTTAALLLFLPLVFACFSSTIAERESILQYT